VKILLAVDGSECSARAVQYLVDHLSLLRETPQLILLHVHPVIPLPRVRAVIGKEALEKYYQEESEAALAPAKTMLTAKGIGFGPVMLVGDPGAVIARYAADEKCTLIVMGTRGLGSLGNLIMGSIATRVLAESKVPVLLVK
jgi:nucleotide-binding universal stress UspA family protein